MKLKTSVCISVVVAVLLGVGIYVLYRMETEALILYSIKRYAKKLVFSIKQNNIRTLVLKDRIYDENMQVTAEREILIKFPDRMKINLKNNLSGGKGFFIAIGDKYWFSETILPGITLDCSIFQVIPIMNILAGTSSMGRIMKEETGIVDMGGKKYFLVTFLFKTSKVKGYFDQSSFRWARMDAFPLNTNGEKGEIVVYPGIEKNIEGLKIPTEAAIYIYSEGKEAVRMNMKIYSIEMNVDIPETNFYIPKDESVLFHN